jgi:hypothetical protein
MRDAVAAQDAELILQWQECRVEGKTTALAELCRDFFASSSREYRRAGRRWRLVQFSSLETEKSFLSHFFPSGSDGCRAQK